MFLRYFILLLSVLYGATTQYTPVALPATDFINVNPAQSVESTETTYVPTAIASCNTSTEWQCADGECIDESKTCNGMFECSDASDEYLNYCNKPGRPMFGLMMHCSSSWSPQHELVCPQICKDEPQHCYYALMAHNGAENTCRFPNYPKHGKYGVLTTATRTNWTDRFDQPEFRLNYTCEETFVLIETEAVNCVNGTWQNYNQPYCSEACRMNKNSNFMYQCPKGSNSSVTCGDYVAIDTTFTVSRVQRSADGSAIRPAALPVMCRKDKTFNLTTSCVKEVDDLQKAFENPTTSSMTKYETRFNAFKTNETGPDFESLVREFHEFESNVRGNLSLMHRMVDECDISLDLITWDMETKNITNETSIDLEKID